MPVAKKHATSLVRHAVQRSRHGARPKRKTGVTIAKNYLTQEEIQSLNLIVSAYLDFAEPLVCVGDAARSDNFARGD